MSFYTVYGHVIVAPLGFLLPDCVRLCVCVHPEAERAGLRRRARGLRFSALAPCIGGGGRRWVPSHGHDSCMCPKHRNRVALSRVCRFPAKLVSKAQLQTEGSQRTWRGLGALSRLSDFSFLVAWLPGALDGLLGGHASESS